MEPATTAAVVAASLPYLDALLGGSRERLKQLGKDLTGEAIDGLHGFWQRLVQVQPKVGELSRAGEDAEQRQELETLVATAVESDTTLARQLATLSPLLRPIAQVANQSGGTTQVTGDKGVNIGRDLNGNLTVS